MKPRRLTPVPRRFKQKMLLQTAHQVAKKSGSAHLKFILNGTASQGMSLTIGSERNANSKRSLSSHETGIAFTTRIPPLRAPERAFRTQKTERGRAMTILEILGSLIGAALVVAAVAYIRRS